MNLNTKKYLCGIMAASLLVMSCPIGVRATGQEENIIEAKTSGSIWFTKEKFTPIPYFSSLSETWKALNEGYKIVVNGNEGTTYLPSSQLDGKENTDEMWYVSLEEEFPKNELITIHAVADSNSSSAFEMPDAMEIDRQLAIKFGKVDHLNVTDTSLAFQETITIKDGGVLTIQNAYGSVHDVAMGTLTFAQPINVEKGGKLNVDFVCVAGKDQKGPEVKYSGNEKPLLTVAEGGSASLKNMDIEASKSSEPLIEVNGDLKVDITPHMSYEPTIQSSGTAIAVAKNATLTLAGGAIKNTGDKPAISVSNGATVVIPEDSKAEVKSTTGKVAIDLAAGSKVQQGKNEITVASVEGESASNYVDNYGNIVLQSGSEDKKVAPNTIIKPDGTAITGNNKLPDVDANGSVTIPEGGAIVTNPDGNKIEVDKGDNVPSIVIGVKNSDGTLATSKRVELGGGPLSLEIATFGVDLKGYSQSVTVDNTNVVKIQGQNKNIDVSPVGVGEATITVTYSKTDAPNDTLSATFKVTVYKNSSGGGGGSTQKLNKVYRAYNPNNGEHLYTLDEKEFKHVTSLGWHDEGVAFMAETEKNGQALYRVYNPNSGLHHYTTDENEKNTLISLGWNEEGIAWYASNKPQSAPVYRVYNPNDGQHHYTVDGHEKDVLVSLGWTYEGIAFKTAPIEK